MYESHVSLGFLGEIIEILDLILTYFTIKD